tara:strand:- start:870 stop:1016 length:147 start_codon:yes stop_codon:yes gene_type:complete
MLTETQFRSLALQKDEELHGVLVRLLVCWAATACLSLLVDNFRGRMGK